jgi:RNA polymerase sigma-70 factor (ECF subfamily)
MEVDARFDRMVRQHQDRIFVFALGMCGSRADAEDAAQDTFVRAYKAMRKYDAARLAELRESAWLHRICLNVCRTRAQRLRVVQELPENVASGDRGTRLVAERLDLRAALDALTPAQRAAVVLRHVVGLSTAEAATAMELPENTVKSHVARGLAALRQRLGDQEVA